MRLSRVRWKSTLIVLIQRILLIVLTVLKPAGELMYWNNVGIIVKISHKNGCVAFFIKVSSPNSVVTTEPCALDFTSCNALGKILNIPVLHI